MEHGCCLPRKECVLNCRIWRWKCGTRCSALCCTQCQVISVQWRAWDGEAATSSTPRHKTAPSKCGVPLTSVTRTPTDTYLLNSHIPQRTCVNHRSHPPRLSYLCILLAGRNCCNSIMLELILLTNLGSMIDKYQTGVMSTNCYSPTDAISDWTLIFCTGVLSWCLSFWLMDVHTVSHSASLSVWSQ